MPEKINKLYSIGWTGPVSSKKYGGIVYGDQLREFLSKISDLDFIEIEGRHFKNKYLKAAESMYNLSKLKGKKDLWIRDFFSVLTMPIDKTSGKNLVIVHHVGFFSFPILAKIIYFMFEKIYFHNLKKADAIVTVSEYWKNYFIKKGYKNVFKAYNSFDLNEFDITSKEVEDFKQKYNLDKKPIIYLGNCQKAKGVVESYEALKDLDVHLVTSGEKKVEIPATNLNLGHKDYLKLLKASSVVITMSQYGEGWCRTIHEAMLLKTPVIGSGFGGMGELLEGGSQAICPDFNNLKNKVQELLSDNSLRKKIGEMGYEYAKNFTNERFEKEWLYIIEKIMHG